ncbi:MAG: AmmeMemoRadiSam system protein B [Candidatus Omnitrophota bacterium]
MFKSIFLFLSFFCLAGNIFSQDIKQADFAGSWYPAGPDILSQDVKNYLKEAGLSPLKEKVIAIISPHAGIAYSGRTAAYSFSAVKDKKVDTIVIIGFSHKKQYDGIAVFDSQGFETPLGILYADKELAKNILSIDKKFFLNPEAFERENSIELILPFVQVNFESPKILLLAMGRQSFENCRILGDAVYEVLKERNNFLIIASTDMSHYLLSPETEKMDSFSAKLIREMRPELLFSECSGKNYMCGLGAVVSTMIAAKKLGADEVKILKRSASSDNPEEKAVGYLSAAFINPVRGNSLRADAAKRASNGVKKGKEVEVMKELLNKQQKQELFKLARDTVTLYVSKKKILEAKTDDSTLKEVMGVFVTLHKQGRLRGCIGNIIGREPLYQGVRDMAVAAASQDPRFAPVVEGELKDIDIEISALSPLKKITNPDEIIAGTHGVLVKDSFRSGVYLPQVATETGWSREEFMNSLCAQKAGMEPDAWKKGECEIYIFTAEVFGE